MIVTTTRTLPPNVRLVVARLFLDTRGQHVRQMLSAIKTPLGSVALTKRAMFHFTWPTNVTNRFPFVINKSVATHYFQNLFGSTRVIDIPNTA